MPVIVESPNEVLERTIRNLVEQAMRDIVVTLTHGPIAPFTETQMVGLRIHLGWLARGAAHAGGWAERRKQDLRDDLVGDVLPPKGYRLRIRPDQITAPPFDGNEVTDVMTRK